jgi:molybdopterin-guanine dinucleotide biosynthesis protein A
VDNISHHTLEWEGDFDTYKAHSVHNEQDIVLVNGNHFKGNNQVVFIHPKKKESLQKKLDRLTSVSLFVLCEGEKKIWDFLETDYSEVPVVKFENKKEQQVFFKNQFAGTVAPLCGLALVGGKSTRMGADKSQLDYHGVPQKEFVKKIMASHVDKVYASEAHGKEKSNEVLIDTFTGLGPFGGILSAFRQFPETAFLVLACDLPLVTEEAVKYLISKRNSSKVATTFLNPQTGFADPLFTIWEPKSYLILLQFLVQGYACPRKVLINSDVELLDLPNENWLRNANTPEEREGIKSLLS